MTREYFLILDSSLFNTSIRLSHHSAFNGPFGWTAVKRFKSWSGVHATLSQKKVSCEKNPQHNDEDEWKPGQTLWRHDAKNDLKLML